MCHCPTWPQCKQTAMAAILGNYEKKTNISHSSIAPHPGSSQACCSTVCDAVLMFFCFSHGEVASMWLIFAHLVLSRWKRVSNSRPAGARSGPRHHFIRPAMASHVRRLNVSCKVSSLFTTLRFEILQTFFFVEYRICEKAIIRLCGFSVIMAFWGKP